MGKKTLKNKIIELKPGTSIRGIKNGDILRLNEKDIFKEGDELVTGISCVGIITTLRRGGDLIEEINRGKEKYNPKTGLFAQDSLGIFQYTRTDKNYQDLDKQLKPAGL